MRIELRRQTLFVVQRRDPHWPDPNYWQWVETFESEDEANADAEKRRVVFPNGRQMMARVILHAAPYLPRNATSLLTAYGDQLNIEETAMTMRVARDEARLKAQRERRSKPPSAAAPRVRRKRDRDRAEAREQKHREYLKRLRIAAGRPDPYA